MHPVRFPSEPSHPACSACSARTGRRSIDCASAPGPPMHRCNKGCAQRCSSSSSSSSSADGGQHSMHPARFPSELPHPACTAATAVAVAAAAWQRPLQPLHLAVACAPSAAVTVAAAAVVLHAPRAAAKATAATAELLSRPWQRPLHAPQQLHCCSRDCSYCTRRGSCCHSHSSGRCMRHGRCAIGGGSNCTRAETAAPTATAAAVACSSVRQVDPRNRRVMQRLAPREPPCMLAHDSHLRAPRAPPAGEYTRIPLSLCPSRSRPAPRARLYSVRHGTFPAAKEALGLQPAASAVSQGSSSVRCREGVEGIARLGSRAAAQQQPMRFAALHRAQ